MAAEVIQSSFGIMRWPHLLVPREAGADNPGAAPKYSATFVAGGKRAGDAEFLSELQRIMNEVCLDKFKLSIPAMMQEAQAKGFSFELALKRNNDPKRSKHEGIADYPEGFHFEAKTQYPVGLFDPQGTKLPSADPTMFYDGAVVRVWTSAYPWVGTGKAKGKYGIGLNLVGVQFVQAGPQLGGVMVKADAVNAAEIPSDLPTAPPPPATAFAGAGAAAPVTPAAQPAAAAAPGGFTF